MEPDRPACDCLTFGASDPRESELSACVWGSLEVSGRAFALLRLSTEHGSLSVRPFSGFTVRRVWNFLLDYSNPALDTAGLMPPRTQYSDSRRCGVKRSLPRRTAASVTEKWESCFVFDFTQRCFSKVSLLTLTLNRCKGNREVFTSVTSPPCPLDGFGLKAKHFPVHLHLCSHWTFQNN